LPPKAERVETLVEFGEQIFFEEIDYVFIPNQKSRDNASATIFLNLL
jgi:hypothetical protein